MDRNLGASRTANSSTDAEAYGDLYQWGRRADGHQCRNSATTSTLSSTDQPANGNFITINSGNFDWRSPQNTNLWQGVNGVNNPCPNGYRLPTETELNAERLSWSSNNAAGALASPLKLPVSGFRARSDGSLLNVGTNSYYWSSTVNNGGSSFLYFLSSGASMIAEARAQGFSVRCIKEASIRVLNCGGATATGTLTIGIAASGVSSSVPYTEGNGVAHTGQIVASTGVTGLTATLAAGNFANGAGSLTYTITGTPATSGTANFALAIGGQTCTHTRIVNLPVGTLTSLNCATATNNGTLTAGIFASSVSSSVPYTGGNGGTHTGQIVASTGVTGLTATLAAGNFANGAGNLMYSITGKPATNGTANFALNIGGQTCTLTRTVVVLPAIQIGTQQWMSKNLDVAFYRNGDPIPQVTDPTAWAGLTTGAWCYYNNDPILGAKFGKLYNWYAVNDPRGLAPEGWHIPSDAEWTTLATTLGGASVAGGKMKEAGTLNWTAPNTGADNSSGWAGLPGGYRYINGSFYYDGYHGRWWSSTGSELYAVTAWYRYLDSNSGTLSRNDNYKRNGLSVRCLRD
jgi:uncharacterized protein (TIGR02145 family)